MKLLEKLLSVRFANPLRPMVTVVYSTIWLHGRYAVTARAGSNFMDLISDQIVDLLPGEPTSALIHAVRRDPRIRIEEVF